MAEDKNTEVAPVSADQGEGVETSTLADALEEAITNEPIDPELIEELKEAEADFRAAERAHLEARRQAEQAAEQLQQIIATVLDAAEVANKAASSASLSHKSLSEATVRISKGASRGIKISGVLVGVSAVFIFGAAGVFAAMSVQLGSKVGQADLLMVKMGTQLIEARDSLAQVRTANQDLMAIAQRNDEIVKANQQIASRVDELASTLKAQETAQARRDKEAAAKFAELSKPKAPPPNPQIEELLRQARALDAQIKAQSKALTEASSKFTMVSKEVTTANKHIASVNADVKQLQLVGSNVNTLKKQLEALIALEQQRYRETLQEATRKGQSEAMVAFPKRDPGAQSENRPSLTN
jgi:hypothetical protein